MEATSIEALIARLAHENPRWRAEAETRLSRMGFSAVPALVAALKSPVVSVRVHAAQALGNMHGEWRLRAYTGMDSGFVHLPVVELCALLGDKEANSAAAIAAEKALVQFGEVTSLTSATKGPNAPRALRALGLIRASDEESMRAMRACLRSEDPPTRTQSGVALLLCLGEAAIEETAFLLGDPDKWVRYGIAEPLAKLGVRRARSVLEAAVLDDEEPWLRGWAEELLSELEDAERAGTARDYSG